VVDVKEAGGVAHGIVFRQWAGRVLNRQLVAGKLHHAPAEGYMGVIKRGA
jgi:hypothetical protein